MKKNLLFNQSMNRAVKGRLIYTILALLCLISGYANAADITITGKVSDAEKGEVLPGVSITIKGTSRGATTDGKGDYTIKVPNKNSVLVFSFLGYESQEIEVGNQTIISVSMVADAKSLEEVVVVGYGTQKKVNLTGAVSTIDSKTIENRPSSNLANALQGTSPGLIITRSSGHQAVKALVFKFVEHHRPMVVLSLWLF